MTHGGSCHAARKPHGSPHGAAAGYPGDMRTRAERKRRIPRRRRQKAPPPVRNAKPGRCHSPGLKRIGKDIHPVRVRTLLSKILIFLVKHKAAPYSYTVCIWL